MDQVDRKFITEDQFNELKPFNKMADTAERITGLSKDEYWFQVTIEITRDCDRHGFAVIESHKR